VQSLPPSSSSLLPTTTTTIILLLLARSSTHPLIQLIHLYTHPLLIHSSSTLQTTYPDQTTLQTIQATTHQTPQVAPLLSPLPPFNPLRLTFDDRCCIHILISPTIIHYSSRIHPHSGLWPLLLLLPGPTRSRKRTATRAFILFLIRATPSATRTRCAAQTNERKRNQQPPGETCLAFTFSYICD